MQSDELIRDLLVNFVGTGEMPYRCYLLNERIDLTTKELKRKLNRKDRKKLESICNDYEKVHIMESDEKFIRGFSFAVQLLSEAYGHKL